MKLISGILIFTLVCHPSYLPYPSQLQSPSALEQQEILQGSILIDIADIFDKPELSLVESLIQASKKIDPWLAPKLLYEASLRQKINFSKKEDSISKETAEIISFIIRYQEELNNLLASDVPELKQNIQKLQQTCWNLLRNNPHIQNTQLKTRFTQPWSLENFHQFYILDLPIFLGENGIYPFPNNYFFQGKISDTILYFYVNYRFYEIASLETPKDLSVELVHSLTKKKIKLPTQEIIVETLHPDTNDFLKASTPKWNATPYFGNIAINLSLKLKEQLL
jgi:hypothetical protein